MFVSLIFADLNHPMWHENFLSLSFSQKWERQFNHRSGSRQELVCTSSDVSILLLCLSGCQIQSLDVGDVIVCHWHLSATNKNIYSVILLWSYCYLPPVSLPALQVLLCLEHFLLMVGIRPWPWQNRINASETFSGASSNGFATSSTFMRLHSPGAICQVYNFTEEKLKNII